MNQQAEHDANDRSRTRFRRFMVRVFLIFAPVHLYVGWSLLPDLPADMPLLVLAGSVLAISVFIIPFGTMASHYVDNRAMADRLVWAGSVTMGWFSTLLVFTVIRDLALFIPGLNIWPSESALIVLAGSVAVTLVGFYNARRVAKVVRVNIPIKQLTPLLDGFTIAQISDIHVGATIKANYVREIVDRVNGLNVDVIAVTGDVVDGKVKELSNDTAPLADLRARYGSYVVTGNHEYYSGAAEWMSEFRRLGLHPLMNEHVVIEHNGTELVIAGVNDFSAERFDPSQGSDPERAIQGCPENSPKILLAHQPRSAHAAEQAGFDLQLSGHTHGGQFWPWNHFVRMQQPFTAGLHLLGDLWVYTSRGTGYWGPPKRFGAPSEITLIRLTVPAAGL